MKPVPLLTEWSETLQHSAPDSYFQSLQPACARPSSSLAAWYRERHCLVDPASLDSTAAHPGKGAAGPPSRLKDASLCWRRSRSRDPAQWSSFRHNQPFFILPHIPVFISTQVFKPFVQSSPLASSGWGLHSTYQG